MNRLWCARCFGVLLSASVLLAGCSGGGDNDVPADNKEDVAALRNLGAKFVFNKSGHIWSVKLSGPAADPPPTRRRLTDRLRKAACATMISSTWKDCRD